MASLNGQTIAASYEQLLHVDADGGGNGTTHVSVKDGDNGTTFGFTIATDALMMTSTNRLEFGDNASYIHQSADGVLDLVSDTEIELNATTIDINGAVDISGLTTSAGNLTLTKGNASNTLIFNADLSSAADNIAFIKGNWNNTTVSQITLFSGSATSPKDDGGMAFATKSTTASLAERMRIASTGNVGIGKSSIDMAQTARTALEIGAEGTFYSHSSSAQGNVTGLGHNYYYSSDGTPKFMRANEESATMEIYNGGFYFYSDSRTDQSADATVTPTSKLTVLANGNVSIAGALTAGDTTVGQSGNQTGILHLHSRTGDNRKTQKITAEPYDESREDVIIIGLDAQSGSNELHIGSNTSANESPTSIDFYTATANDSATNNRTMRIGAGGDVQVGNGTAFPGFTPAFVVQGSNPSLGLRLQDSNSGSFFNTQIPSDGSSIKTYYSQAYSLATASNDGGTSANDRFTLDTSGNISIDGNLTEGSDIRLKTNIEKIPNVLDALDEIDPVTFEWKDDVKEGLEKKNIGLIAQEVEKHFPELIYEGTTRDTEGTTYKGLNYAGLTPVLLKAIQELSLKVTELENKLGE